MISSSEQKKKRPRAFLFFASARRRRRPRRPASRPYITPRNDSAAQAVEKACHCEPVRRLAWQSVSQRGTAALTGRRGRRPLRSVTAHAVGRGPRAPPKNAYPAAGHMGPALQVHTPPKTTRRPLRGGAVRQCRLLRRGGGRAEASAPRGCSSPPGAWPRPAPAGRAGRWRGR